VITGCFQEIALVFPPRPISHGFPAQMDINDRVAETAEPASAFLHWELAFELRSTQEGEGRGKRRRKKKAAQKTTRVNVRRSERKETGPMAIDQANWIRTIG
jgi:hypothetical protein